MKFRLLAGLIIGAVLCAGISSGEDKTDEIKDKAIECGRSAVEVGSALYDYTKDKVASVFSEIK